MKSVLKVVFLFFLCDELGLIKCSDDHHSNGGHGLYSFPHQEGLPLEDFDLPHNRVVPAIPITSSCAAFIDFFGELAANFTQCVVQFARPLRACENCVEQYILAKNAFDYVMKGKHKDEHGNDCGEMVLNSDRIQIILRTEHFITSMWDDCYCDSCFDFVNGANGTVHYKRSNETLRFNMLAAQTQQCFRNYSGTHQISNDTGTNVSAVCLECIHEYTELNLLYNEMEESQHHHVCMDIVDEMNSTRLQWSKGYGCSHKAVDATTVFIISGVFSLLPIIFYVGNRIHVSRSRRTVLNQNDHPRTNNNAGNEIQEETSGNN